MKLRIYFDNQIITYVLSLLEKKFPKKDVHLLMEIASVKRLFEIKSLKIEILVSEENLAEIHKHPSLKKRARLEKVYYFLKQAKPVIRNSSVTYNDSIATYNSSDVFYDHLYTDKDLDEVFKFLSEKIPTKDEEKLEAIRFDARYIANAMLKENQIDFFVTNDKKTIWKFKKEIEEKFSVKVRLPSELAEYLKYII